MSSMADWDRREGVIQEWLGWFRALPPLLPVASGCALALIGSALTYSGVPPWVSGLVALGVLIILGWGANSGVRAWIEGKESLLTAFLLLISVGMIQAYSGFLVISDSWGSLKFASYAIAAFSILGALIILLPVFLRKIVLLLLMMLHFGGIMTAVTAVDPPGQPGPWLSGWLWASFYRPYLQFFYLNNAYHFYSPEPGPPVLVWFRIDYTDNKSKWYKIPDIDEEVSLLYFRQLSLTELGTNMAVPYFPNNFNDVIHARNLAGLDHVPRIPQLPAEISNPSAYRQPNQRSLDNLSSYARHVANKFPHPVDNPEASIKQIRIYRITHIMLTPLQLQKGKHPKDPSTYLPYFYGDYDVNGKLLNPSDGLLWFSLPIFDQEEIKMNNPNGYVLETNDYFKLHSGLDITKERR